MLINLTVNNEITLTNRCQQRTFSTGVNKYITISVPQKYMYSLLQLMHVKIKPLEQFSNISVCSITQKRQKSGRNTGKDVLHSVRWAKV